MASRPQVERINLINIGLMLLSAAVAWVAPFELLLASYAVLGPLHYLTEISWLHERRYFTTGVWDAPALVALALLGFLARFTGFVAWDGWVVLALGLAGAFAFASEPRWKAVLIGAAIGLTLLLERWPAPWLFLLIMLPTVIHVFGFTGVFLLHGSIRSRSVSGYASVAVFACLGLGLLLYQPAAAQYAVSPRTAALGEEFGGVFDQLAWLTRSPTGWNALAAFGRFLAFAYTYHYLNWFSKTGIIGWHEVGGARLGAIAILWIASLALYAYDYSTGLAALFVLSLAHVLLELPLDLRTIASLAGRPVQA